MNLSNDFPTSSLKATFVLDCPHVLPSQLIYDNILHYNYFQEVPKKILQLGSCSVMDSEETYMPGFRESKSLNI
jgi:hypothetical protein